METSQWLDLGLEDLDATTAQRVRAFRLLLASAGRLRAAMDRTLADSGLTTQQAAVLQWIEAQQQAPTLTAVASALGMTHQNLKQIVVAVERKGLVTLETDEQDRRQRRVTLTRKHRLLWQQRNPADYQQVTQWTAALTDQEVKVLTKLLRKLHASI